MSPHHAAGLRGFAEHQKEEVIHLRDRFEPSTPDSVWLKELGLEGGWIVISGDMRISRNRVEREVWHESKLTVFFFCEPWAQDRYWKQVATLMSWWETIAQQARETPTGHGFAMPKGGKELKCIYPTAHTERRRDSRPQRGPLILAK